MQIEQLPREFIYTDLRTLDDFLRRSKFNQEMYKVYLEVKDKPYYFKFQPEQAFNEAYYIATMAALDPHPELKVREWSWIAKDDMGWRYAANLVMSMVYAILAFRYNGHGGKMAYVLPLMDKQDYGKEHFPAFREMVSQLLADMELPIGKWRSEMKLAPNPLPVAELRARKWEWDWVKITDDFNQDTIRELVELFRTKEEKLAAIDLMEQAMAKSSVVTPPQTKYELEEYLDLPF